MTIAVWVLLGIGMAAVALSAAGMLLARNVYARLHYMAPAASVGAVAIAAAVVLREGFSQAGIKAVLVALLIFFVNPILTHATARAARVHLEGQWQPKPDEHFPPAGGREAV